MGEEVRGLMRELHDNRVSLAVAKDGESTLWVALEEVSTYIAWKNQQEHRQQIEKQGAEIRKRLEEAAIQAHREGEALPDGVKIIREQVVVIEDERDALDWAKVNMPALLTLEIKGFRALVKDLGATTAGNMGIPARIEEREGVRVASDLSKYL